MRISAIARFLFVVLVAVPAFSQSPARHVILISVDGMRPMEYAAPGGAAPGLRAIAESGCFSPGAVGVFPSVTYPSHTTIITGEQPAVHGVLSNTLLDPLNKTDGGWYYFADQIHVPALWDEVRAAKMTSAAISWPVSVGAPVDYLIPEYRPVQSEEDVRLLRALSTNGLVERIEKVAGPVPVPLTDAWRTKAAVAIYRVHRPALMLLHLEELDHASHIHGPGSPDPNSTLRAIDGYIAGLMKELNAIDNDIAWVIVSDHGFQPIGNQLNAPAVLRELGLIEYDGRKVKSWRVYSWVAGGMFALIAKDPNDTDAIHRATDRFRELASDPKNGIHRVYSAAELKSLGSFPNAFLAVDMGPGFTAGENPTGDIVTASTSKGMHGYGPDNPASRISLILAGSGVRHCSAPLQNAKSASIAASVAYLLGLRSPAMQKQTLREALQ